MGRGNAHSDPPDKEEAKRPLPLPAVASLRLHDAPILLLVYFHTAMRAELAELRRLAVAAAADDKSESHLRDFAVEVLRRFEFLKLVHKYHCAAEDEVSSDCSFVLFGCQENERNEKKKKIGLSDRNKQITFFCPL